MNDEFEFDVDDALSPPPQAAQKPKVLQSSTSVADTSDSPDDFMAALGIEAERTVPDITKPWMKHHKFELVRSIEQLKEIVDKAIARGECALDLETEGLDNRIFYDTEGKPYTKHQIVGFCLSYDGLTGYYAPVRHNPDDGGTSLNLPIAEAEAEIRRLCLASQPIGAAKGIEQDPLSYKEWERAPQVIIHFWHAKFDQEFLYPITGIDWWHPDSFEDGNLLYFVHYSGDRALSLKDKAKEELRDIEGNVYEMIKLKELFIQGRRNIEFAKLSPDEPGCIKYACSDAICTFLLCTGPRKHEKERLPVLKTVKEKYNFTYRLEKQTSQAGRWMERPRVRVNREKIEQIRIENKVKRDEVAAKIKSLAANKGFPEFEPGSSKQLSDFLFGDQGLNITLPINNNDWPNGKPPLNEKSGQYKTDADTLERLVEEHPSAPDVLNWIVEWRQYEKLDGTYLQNMVDNIDERSEMRFQFKQTGAQTGRFSAPAGAADQGYSGIPIHGIPGTSALRQAFESRDGYTMVKADYAGQELRIAANVSGEEVWIKEFLEGDGDLHSITARAFFGKQEISKDERKMGKIANFALIYGGGPAAIMRATGCDKVEATRRKQAFDKAVPTFAKWVKGQHKKVKEEGGVWTALKRWIAIPPPKGNLLPEEIRKQEAARERAATNFPVQGTGADVMKISLVLLFKEFYKRGWLRQNNGDDSVRLLLTVHDEIVFEIRHDRVQEALVIITKVMASPTYMAGPSKWRVPLVVEPLIGMNWAGEYDYGMLMHGKPYKDGDKVKNLEVVVGDRVYHQVPPWLVGKFIPPYAGGTPEGGGGGSTPSGSPDAPTSPSNPPTSVPIAVAGIALSAVAKADKPVDVMTAIFTIKIGILTKRSVAQVMAACGGASDPDNGKVLCLVDAMSGRELIDPSKGVRVVPERLAKALRDINLSDGVVYPYVRRSAAS